MANKAKRYLKTNLKQNNLLEEIKSDIKELCKKHNLDTNKIQVFDLMDAISIQIDGEFDTKIIPAMDKYMGLKGVIDQQHLKVAITYPLNYEEYTL